MEGVNDGESKGRKTRKEGGRGNEGERMKGGKCIKERINSALKKHEEEYRMRKRNNFNK